MKKFAIICILLFCSIFYVACKSDEMHELGLKNDSICVELNESKSLKELGFEFSNKYNINDFSFIYNNDYISYKNSNFKFEKLGKTNLTVFLKTGENRVERKVLEVIIELGNMVESDIIENKVILDINNIYNLKSNIQIDNSLQEFLVFRNENNEVIASDFICNQIGEFKVLVNIEKADKVVNLGVFNIIVENNIYVEEVMLSNAKAFDVLENSSGVIDFKLLPANANCYEIISDSENFEIDKSGAYVAKDAISNVEIVVKYKNANKEEFEKVYCINIIEKVEIIEVEILKNEIVKSAFAGQVEYEIRIVLSKAGFNSESIQFDRSIQVLESDIDANMFICKVNFNQKLEELKFSYLNQDSFFNQAKIEYLLNDFVVFDLNDLSIKIIDNLENELLFLNNYETLYLIDKAFAGTIEHAYGINITCKVNSKDVDYDLQLDSECFDEEKEFISSKNASDLAILTIEIYGKEFTFNFKIKEIEITDIKVESYSDKLYYNSENNKTNFKLTYNCNYSTQIKNLKVQFNSEYLMVDLEKQEIEVVDYNFYGNNNYIITFSIGGVSEVITINVEATITQVKLKDLANNKEYNAGEEIACQIEEAFSYILILCSGENALQINFDSVVKMSVMESGGLKNVSDEADYLKTYNPTLNVIQFNESGKFVLSFENEELKEFSFYLKVN